MKTTINALPFLAALALLANFVLADWDPGDPYKMHYPQLPDPNGWDVNVSDYTLADDWQCIEEGPIRQVHIWISWTNDWEGVITNIHLSIHDNMPPPPYSRPGVLLWEHDFLPFEFKYRWYQEGYQGWYDPASNIWWWPDHFNIYQLNIRLHPDKWFYQMYGEIYWLDVKLDVTNGLAGWKTSTNHWEDDAVWWSDDFGWMELRDPETGESLDLAFVIDPIPESAAALATVVAIVGLCRRARRQ